MSATREINIKPSCMSELHAFPSDQTARLWEKVDLLVTDPFPDGKVKKKLKGKQGIYRLRIGSFRLFYTFGDDWVRLLGIRKRDERTYKDKLEGVEADEPISAPGSDVEIPEEEPVRQERPFRLADTEDRTGLPREITAEWLADLGVAPAFIPTLVGCQTEEDLLGVDVPAVLVERVIDNLFPRPLEEVENQPDLVVQSPTDLVRYKEGELVTFLLRLDPEQRRLADWALEGPTMVKGGAGTGKSTVALYRVKALLDKSGSTGQEKVLFTTYTRALIAASRQLLEQLLDPEQMKRVRVASCDQVAREIVAASEEVGQLASGGGALEVLRSVRGQFSPSGPSAFGRRLRSRGLARMSDRYLMEEIDWIIDGRGLESLDEYLEAPRPGRGLPLQKGPREAIWELREKYHAELALRGIRRFSDLRQRALDLVRSGAHARRYDFVVVDEIQDLTPTAVCLMAELATSERGLFFASDAKQSLYCRNYTWSVVHPRLRFTGRTALLKRNYRSTAEIEQAAFDILEPEDGETVEPSVAVRRGPLPVLLRGVKPSEESRWIARFVRQMSKHLRLRIDTAAILVPSKTSGELLAEGLSRQGLKARFSPGRELDLSSDEIKVLALHSAKGLEFPLVVLAGFHPGTYPLESEFGDEEVFRERVRNERRLLYVGMSRAMRALMVVEQDTSDHPVLGTLNEENWHGETVT